MATTPSKVKIDRNSRAYKLFVGSIKSPSSRQTYETVLPAFIAFAGYDNLEKMLKAKPKALDNKLIDFVLEKRKTLSYSTVNVHLAAIKKLCFMNDITDINWDKVYSFLGEHIKTVKDRIYTIEEIHRMMDRASFRNKVMILILVSTGIRVGALPGLKLRHLNKIEEERLYQFTIYENSKEEYITFCTPECGKALDTYFEYRKRAGEIIGPESPLIREEFDSNNANDVQRVRGISIHTLRRTIRTLLIQTGIRAKSTTRERKELMLAHAFRKYFNTALIKAGAKPIVKEILMGHSVKLDDSYYRPTTSELLAEYLKGVDLLTVSREKQLRLEVDKLKMQTQDLDIMKKSYLDMKFEYEARIDKLEGQVVALRNHIDDDLLEIVRTAVAESLKDSGTGETIPRVKFAQMALNSAGP